MSTESDHDQLIRIKTIIETDHEQLKARVMKLEEWKSQRAGEIASSGRTTAIVLTLITAVLGIVVAKVWR